MLDNLKIGLVKPVLQEDQDTLLSDWFAKFPGNLNYLLSRYGLDKVEIAELNSQKSVQDVLAVPGALIVPVSTGLLENKTYHNILDLLADRITAQRGLKDADDKSIFRIELSTVDYRQVPEFLLQAPVCNFFSLSGEEKVSSPVLPESPDYWPRLLDLASDILRSFKKKSEAEEIEHKFGNSVFLALTTPGMSVARDLLRRELQEQGFIVYPDIDLYFNLSELRSYIQKCVDRSLIAIHLFGDVYGELYPGTDKDICELQFGFVTEYIEALYADPELTKGSKLQRLIWLPADLKPTDDRQVKLVQQLKKNIEKLYRTEIVQAPVELFKTLIVKKLREYTSQAEKHLNSDTKSRKLIYLVHEINDDKNVGKVEESLKSKGFDTVRIRYDNGQENLIIDHKSFLIDCDAALIYHKSGSYTWLMSKVKDLLKAPGMGRISPLLARGIIFFGKDPVEKLNVPSVITVMKADDAFECLEPFLNNLM